MSKAFAYIKRVVKSEEKPEKAYFTSYVRTRSELPFILVPRLLQSIGTENKLSAVTLHLMLSRIYICLSPEQHYPLSLCRNQICEKRDGIPRAEDWKQIRLYINPEYIITGACRRFSSGGLDIEFYNQANERYFLLLTQHFQQIFLGIYTCVLFFDYILCLLHIKNIFLNLISG